MIYRAPADVLTQVADPVEDFAEAQLIVDDLIREADQWEKLGKGGVAGLAAPQIGVSKRVFIYRKGKVWVPVINPVILRFGPKDNVATEGCLSLPGVTYVVSRPMSIVATWQDTAGDNVGKSLGVPLARVFQHENDHLDGKLISDGGNQVASVRTA